MATRVTPGKSVRRPRLRCRATRCSGSSPRSTSSTTWRLAASFLNPRASRIVYLPAGAKSLCSVESPIEHPASMTPGSIPGTQRKALEISDGLIRVSVGIEHVEDLRSDLKQAFAYADE